MRCCVKVLLRFRFAKRWLVFSTVRICVTAVAKIVITDFEKLNLSCLAL